MAQKAFQADAVVLMGQLTASRRFFGSLGLAQIMLDEQLFEDVLGRG